MSTYGVTVVSRNDNHGGHLNERALYCLYSLIDTYDEVIYVDWNSDNDTLIDAIKDELPKTGKLRCLTVTPKQHKEITAGFNSPQNCPQYLGKNIGASRLETDFIAVTNIDEINPPRYKLELFNGTDTMITVARRNISLPIARSFGSYKDIVKVRSKLMLEKYDRAFPVSMTSDDIWSLIAWPGELQIAHRDIWNAVGGFAEWQFGHNFGDSYLQRKVKQAGYKIDADFDIPVWHMDHERPKGDWQDNSTDCLTAGFTHEENLNWGFPNISFKEVVI